jgi:PAS domain S-box-containing protein
VTHEETPRGTVLGDVAERVLDAVPDGIVLVGDDGVVVLANRRARAILGSDDVAGHGVATFPEGTEVAESAVTTEHGTLTCLLLRPASSTEAKFEALLEAAPDAILGVDSDGVIRIVNRQAVQLFGYDREELLGYPLDRLVPERHRAVHPSHRSGYFRAPRTRPMGAGMRLAAVRKDGTEFPADIALSHIQTEDGPIATAVVRDVSEQWAWAERERLQAQLNQSQRLESLGRLAGGVAHDFNNLLAIILNYAVFARDVLRDDGTYPEALADVEQIHEAAERAATLTHQLLMFSRREVVKQEVIDLNVVVGELDKLLRRTLGEDVALTTRLDPGLWRITADPSQMEQVLVNLAVNARDALPAGGVLVVETANVNVDADSAVLHAGPEPRPGPYVRLSVSDSGTGMTPETIDRAFEPFFTTKPRGEGSGLGLATVYGVVTDTGGHIGVYSEIGLGTTFRIYLPATQASVTERGERDDDRAARGRGETVLVTEDEDAVREMAARILGRNGYEVVSARSGEEALALLADETLRVDLLLTDVVMPGMPGTELAERARVLRPGLRTVFMSGYSEELLGRRIQGPGLWLLEKPFTADALLVRVREVLDDA